MVHLVGAGEEPQDQSEPPVLSGHDRQDAGQQEEAARDPYDELRQEAGQVHHVAVDPLEQLARGMLVVERQVEAKDVAQQVRSQPIRRPPTDVA